MVKSPFTATRLQVATYLLGVALFSISFLVFLNSSVSFVITDLIGRKTGVGDAVGTLGFADELVALVACPLWGLASDRLGVRSVCALGYCIVGIALFVFVQAKNVYPALLLARILFSVGGAATATMVTAILPSMTANRAEQATPPLGEQPTTFTRHGPSNSISSETTVTPARYRTSTSPSASPSASPGLPAAPRIATAPRSANSQTAGLVGMFTGLGALLALGAFLPLPATFQRDGSTPGDAIAYSYYVVGIIAIAVAFFCFVGLAGLSDEQDKGWRSLFNNKNSMATSPSKKIALSYGRSLFEATRLGFTDVTVGLGYLAGFVARASSVGVSLFIPVYVNAYFISTGLCKGEPDSAPGDIKDQCRRAYTLAAALTGVSQLFALIFAPIFGFADGRLSRYNIPLLVASVAGVLGYVLFPQLSSPDPKSENGSSAIFVVVALLGISQIGAIVCSLSLLGRGIQAGQDDLDDEQRRAKRNDNNIQDPQTGLHDPMEDQNDSEASALLPSHLQRIRGGGSSRAHLKGSIAGIYSLAGGAGILLLTKLGGALFDSLSFGAPFYMLAIFNALLLVVGILCTVGSAFHRAQTRISI